MVTVKQLAYEFADELIGFYILRMDIINRSFKFNSEFWRHTHECHVVPFLLILSIFT